MKYTSRFLAGFLLIFMMFGAAFAAVTDEDIKAWVERNEKAIYDDWVELVLIPGKSRKEEQRVEWVQKKFVEAGLENVRVDPILNVIGTMKGDPGNETVLLAVQMDTLFDLDADQLKAHFKVEDGWLHCPGSGDNTPAAVGLTWLKRALDELKITPKVNLIFLATSQEEVGLYGMKYYLANNPRPDMVVSVDGSLGSLSAGGMGINWYKVYARTPGRHTNRSWGFPSAMKSMALAVAEAYKFHERDNPEPTLRFNLGVIGGGTVENAVAEEVWVTLDIRNQDADRLKAFEDEVFAAMQKAIEDSGGTSEKEVVMEISAGQIPGAENHKVVQLAQETLRALGFDPTVSFSGSNDGNASMALGIPTASIGYTESEGGHSVDERTKIESIYVGMRQLLMLVNRLN